MKAELTIRHLGRATQATVRGGDAQLKKFRNALLLKNFVLTSESEERLTFRRRAYMLHDDWPMRVVIRREGNDFEIRYWLCIPWVWIVGFVALILIVLPFGGIRRADMMFVLGSLAAGLAIYKQKFDCSPNAPFWQAEPRRRWHETMEQLLRDAFGGG
jgi:hypothetical protein